MPRYGLLIILNDTIRGRKRRKSLYLEWYSRQVGLSPVITVAEVYACMVTVIMRGTLVIVLVPMITIDLSSNFQQHFLDN